MTVDAPDMYALYCIVPLIGWMDWVGAYGQSDGQALVGGWKQRCVL